MRSTIASTTRAFDARVLALFISFPLTASNFAFCLPFEPQRSYVSVQLQEDPCGFRACSFTPNLGSTLAVQRTPTPVEIPPTSGNRSAGGAGSWRHHGPPWRMPRSLRCWQRVRLGLGPQPKERIGGESEFGDLELGHGTTGEEIAAGYGEPARPAGGARDAGAICGDA